MIRVRQIKIDVLNDFDDNRFNLILKKMKLKKEDIISYKISKQSIDARDKNNIYYVYEFILTIKNESNYLKHNKNKDITYYEEKKDNFIRTGTRKLTNNIVVVGSGPAGLFATYNLLLNGYKVTLIERGKRIEERIKDVENFWENNKLNESSNVQFGEGGAGTFSDGKLNTQIKDTDNYTKRVFETFVMCGAEEEILYSYKPHIGTDKLRCVIVNMRNKILEMGGTILYNSTLTNLIINNNSLEKIEINNKEIITCNALVLAIGHSSRDTFYMLHKNKLNMENKPFAVGLRIQHKQSMINESQYGLKYKDVLPASSYKLTYQTQNKRGVYTFCMCPGGFVVNASSENKRLVINGMSNYNRDEENANSAIIVTVNEKDYGTNILDGIKYQRKLEEKAYNLCNGLIPIQLFKDYKDNIKSRSVESIEPVMKGKYDFANLNELFNEDINNAIKDAIDNFGKKIKGFNNDDVVLAGIETRTSSPIRIIRNENFESNIKGIFPCGEGAGYAGGITSSSIDGIKVSEAIGKIYE